MIAHCRPQIVANHAARRLDIGRELESELHAHLSDCEKCQAERDCLRGGSHRGAGAAVSERRRGLIFLHGRRACGALLFGVAMDWLLFAPQYHLLILVLVLLALWLLLRIDKKLR